jgi:hypothetical protein
VSLAPASQINPALLLPPCLTRVLPVMINKMHLPAFPEGESGFTLLHKGQVY